MIKLALVDDDAIVRDNFRRIFSLFDEVKILWAAKDGEDALKRLQDALVIPDVILMDIEMRKMNGIEATHKIRAGHPEIKIVMLSIVNDEERVRQAFFAGAEGYLLKDEKPLKMLELIKDAIDERFPLSPAIARLMLNSLRKSSKTRQNPEKFHLTKREIEILKHLVLGETYKKIGHALNVSPLTVRSHMENIYNKLNVNSKVEAVSDAIRNGWF